MEKVSSLPLLFCEWFEVMEKKNREKNPTHYETLVRYKVISEGRKGN